MTEARRRLPKSVLWVEDWPEDNLSFFRVLERHGVDVSEARTVAEALGMLRTQEYEVVVLDLAIPLGPECVELEETRTENGKYILHAIERGGAKPPKKTVLFTNFRDAAARLVEGKNIPIVSKTCYIREFIDAIKI